MAQHNTNITVPNSPAGTPADQTGIMGIICEGVAVAGKLVLDRPYALLSTDDLVPLGIDAAYDIANSCAVFYQVSKYYAQAGPGALLWLQVTAVAGNYTAYVASTAFSDFVKYTAQADPSQQAKIIGLCYAVPTATQAATDFPADVLSAITACQTVYAQQFAKGYCFSFVLDGTKMSTAVTPVTIATLATRTAYAVSLCITGSMGNGVSDVGLFLGKCARIRPGRGVGAVADQPINTSTSYLTNGILIRPGTALVVDNEYTVQGGQVTYNAILYNVGATFTVVEGVTAFTSTAGGYVLYNSTLLSGPGGMDFDDINVLALKQFLFVTPVQNISGLFWNDGSTCISVNSFYSSQEYDRVINYLSYNARAFFTQYRGEDLPTNVNTGALDEVFCRTSEVSFYKKYIAPLTVASGTGDIVDGSITISGATFEVDGQLNFQLSAVRKTILGNVVGTVQFVVNL